MKKAFIVDEGHNLCPVGVEEDGTPLFCYDIATSHGTLRTIAIDSISAIYNVRAQLIEDTGGVIENLGGWGVYPVGVTAPCSKELGHG